MAATPAVIGSLSAAMQTFAALRIDGFLEVGKQIGRVLYFISGRKRTWVFIAQSDSSMCF